MDFNNSMNTSMTSNPMYPHPYAQPYGHHHPHHLHQPQPPVSARGGAGGSVQGDNNRPSRPGSALSMASGYGPPGPVPGGNYQTGAYGHPMMYPYNHYYQPPPMYGHYAQPMGHHDPYMPPHMRYKYM